MYDATFTTHPNKKGITRQVYAHEMYTPNDYTINSSVSDFHALDDLCIEINQAFHGNNATRLSIQQWKQLTPAAQTTWDTLDNAAKRTILERRTHFGYKPPPTPSPTSANLHDMSAYKFINADLHDSHIGGNSIVKDNIDEETIQHEMDTTMLNKL
jgi:hypothetical protein